MGACRGDRRCPWWQADAFQVAGNGAGLGECRDDFHMTAAAGAHGDVDAEHSAQEGGPGQAVSALGGCRLTSSTGDRLWVLHLFLWIHGVWAQTILDDEQELFFHAKETRGLDDTLALTRVMFHRALRVHRDLQLRSDKGQRVSAEDLDRSFSRIDRLARNLGNLVEIHMRVSENREVLDLLAVQMERCDEILERESTCAAGTGPRLPARTRRRSTT